MAKLITGSSKSIFYKGSPIDSLFLVHNNKENYHAILWIYLEDNRMMVDLFPLNQIPDSEIDYKIRGLRGVEVNQFVGVNNKVFYRKARGYKGYLMSVRELLE